MKLMQRIKMPQADAEIRNVKQNHKSEVGNFATHPFQKALHPQNIKLLSLRLYTQIQTYGAEPLLP